MMPMLEDILRDRIKELEKQLKTQDEIIDSLTDDLKCYQDAEEQGLLHIAPLPNGTVIYILNDDDPEFFGDDREPIIEISYLYGCTEFAYGEKDKDWFTTWEAAEEALRKQF